MRHICARHFRDTWFFIIEVIATHDTYKLIRKMDDISSCQLLVLRHEGDTILQNEVMFIRRFVGLDAVIPNDLVEALHRHIEDKTFITVDLPLLIIREGTQLEDVAPVHILKDLGIDYIGQCNFVVTFIQRKDDGWLRRGGSYGLDSKVYRFIDTRQLAAGVSAACSGSGHVLGIV